MRYDPADPVTDSTPPPPRRPGLVWWLSCQPFPPPALVTLCMGCAARGCVHPISVTRPYQLVGQSRVLRDNDTGAGCSWRTTKGHKPSHLEKGWSGRASCRRRPTPIDMSLLVVMMLPRSTRTGQSHRAFGRQCPGAQRAQAGASQRGVATCPRGALPCW